MLDQKIQLYEPAYYRIKVSRKLSPEEIRILSNYFATDFIYQDYKEYSLLKGQVKDQAALSGLLSYLTDLRCILLSVTQK